MQTPVTPRKRKRESGPANPRSGYPDLISTLPDAVLASILSLLPIREAVRTSTLSSRWRHIWTITPLSFDDRCLDTYTGVDGDYYASFEKSLSRSREIVSRILSSHHGPIRRCSLSKFYESRFFQTANAHIETLTKKGIEELALHFSCHQQELYTMPSSIVFCKSLSKLSLQNCRFMEPPFPSTCFPNLKDLQIKGVKISDKTIHALLATSCLCLESLELCGHCDASLIRVSSSTLRKLCLKFYESRPKRIIIEDAPNLKQLLLGETMMNCDSFVVLHAPNLEMLGFVALEARLLQLGNSFLRQEPRRISAHPQKLRPILIDISSMMTSIKTLAIKVMFGDHNTKKLLPAFLRCFPCLESLDLMLVADCFAFYDIHWEKLGPFDFIKHLKTVTIKHFGESFNKDVKFARFLVSNCRVLKKMTLLYRRSVTKKWKENLSRQLCMDYKVSSELEVIFVEDSHNNANFRLWNKLIE